jgi:Ca2+-binding EF-hand superfamily protein
MADKMMTQGYVPEFMKTRQAFEQSLGNIKTGMFDPFIKETFGYESPESKINTLMSNTDFSSKESIQNTFNTLMKQDPMKAAKWLKDSEAAIKLFDKKQLSMSDIRTKQLIDKETQEERANQLVGLVGTPTDYDSAVKVLKILDAQGLTGTDRYKGLKQDLRSYQEKIGATVTDAYRSSVADKADEMIKFPGFDSFFGGKTLPKIANYDYWNNEDNLADFVAGYSKAFKQDPAFVIREILEGRIDPNKGYAPAGSASTTQAPKSNINNSSGFVPNFDLSKPFN